MSKLSICFLVVIVFVLEFHPVKMAQDNASKSLPAECGIKVNQGRIFGGTEAPQHAWPWQASIIAKSTGIPACGGSLINKRWVITAAHCLVHPVTGIKFPLKNMRLLLGGNSISKAIAADKISNGNPNDGYLFDLEKTIIYKGYNLEDSTYDIALIKLNKDVPVTNTIGPICLPSDPNEVIIGQRATATGWGMTKSASYSDVLLQVDVPIISQTICTNMWGPEGKEAKFCAGGESGKDSCEGDSGGPLVMNKLNKWHLYGVTSFGPPTCATSIPAVYTKVSFFRSWIINAISSN